MGKKLNWTKRNAMFPGFEGNGIPSLASIEDLFLDFSPDKWTTDGGVFYSSGDGDSASLYININSDYGFWIRHRSKEDGFVTNAFSLGDPRALSEYVPIVEDSVTLKGLFIAPARAWLAVKYFIATEGGRSNDIEWIFEKDIPEGKHWLVSVDCL